ncbi:patatin-like phospholipase family protein [Sphingomonas sp. PAMC 26617]|uniref:patatin-like phospholipase family protein n=1 Tax=Sphingomonas sp. PAMC 26617 TaxID=1112216 RepID=UPI001E5C3802|nr:patatin-like phospholipase family protein [Sphingomonas sp. PAMC 26617]
MDGAVNPENVGRAGRVQQTAPFDCIALVLQGGGALGAYQAGVYEALAQAALYPNWVAGISIGAINAALIAGNAPEQRVEKLRAFWQTVTADPWAGWFATPAPVGGDLLRHWANHWHAAAAVMTGAAGFFAPRQVPAYFAPAGSADAISFYDTTALKTTLERLVDFDRINAGDMRFQRRRGERGDGQSGMFRQSNARDPARARHCQRRAPAGLRAGRDRRRVLLGRRGGFEHAAPMGRR